MINVNRFVVVSSANATKLQKENSSETMRRNIYDPLMQFGRPIIDLVQPTEDELSDTIQPYDAAIIAGGDGTLNWILNALIRLKLNKKINLIPQPLGGMNDIATSLYGRQSIDDTIKTGSSATAYTIEATHYMDDNTTETVNALGYVGLGASGVAALAVDYNPESTYQKYSDIFSAARAILETEIGFEYLDYNGDIKKAYELLFMKTRMAGFIRPPSHLLFEEAYYSLSPKSRTAALGQLILGLISKAGRGSIQTKDNVLSVTPKQHIFMQADGEHRIIKANETLFIKNGSPVSIIRADK